MPDEVMTRFVIPASNLSEVRSITLRSFDLRNNPFAEKVQSMVTLHKGSDRPEFGSVPVPAEITTKISVPVSVLAKFVISVSAKISVQKRTESQYSSPIF